MDNFNSFSQNSPPYGYYGTSSQPFSNIILVTSLEEAVMRTTKPGSDMVYFNQNGTEFYRVKMEMNGAKYHQTFPYSMPEQTSNVPLTKSDIEPILLRLEELEKKVGKQINGEQSS